MLFHIGSNKGDVISFSVANFTFSVLAKVATAGFTKTKEVSTALAITFSTGGAEKLIESVDKIIAAVDGQRANLGAIQNRLESSIRNQSNVAANEADARSRIRDADFAEESANLSQQSIIQQAAASMLMQANTRPQLGLSLLG